VTTPLLWWRALSARGKTLVVLAVVATAVCAVASVVYVFTSDGLSIDSPENPRLSYLWVFLLVALDGVIPIFPGETTLNAASTMAAQGKLDLGPIIVMGALGAIVGDSGLFWLARTSSRKFEGRVAEARSNDKVRQALALLDSSAPLLIIGGRYLPGMRFVVNASMGLSTIRYRRFLVWSVIGGTLWSVFTCVLAYQIGVALGDNPLASFIIAGLVTTVVLAVIFLVVRHRRARGRPDGQDSVANHS
jgi:membrane-associated protein